jgi:hypothetical protein
MQTSKMSKTEEEVQVCMYYFILFNVSFLDIIYTLHSHKGSSKNKRHQHGEVNASLQLLVENSQRQISDNKGNIGVDRHGMFYVFSYYNY